MNEAETKEFPAPVYCADCRVFGDVGSRVVLCPKHASVDALRESHARLLEAVKQAAINVGVTGDQAWRELVAAIEAAEKIKE